MTSGNGWRVIGASVRGAAHVRRNLPNQDALLWSPEEGTAGVLTVAIADGHGSEKCFRSEIGSAIAVRVAIEVLSQGISNPGAEIVGRWRAEVQQHIAAHPEVEVRMVAAASSPAVRGPEGPRGLKPTPHAYGSTLVAVHATQDELFFLQVGDGDAVIVTADGEAVRPFAPNLQRLGVETESLCMRDAVDAVQIAIRPLSEGLPPLVMLSTDGYANSFRDDGEFLRVATDLLALIQESGADRVNESLSSWLEEASRLGSGDDITAALLISVKEREDGAG